MVDGDFTKKWKSFLVRLAFCKSIGHVHILKTLEEGIYTPLLSSISIDSVVVNKT